ncbi:hypothetical protein PIB30_091568 [Stylosanthes scabra]|uniref:Uncharacterized protein n=1 Tax=Stylosanthes scabra TaxID=79078 RepID=A0ABU6ZTX1_9FABA|nr:hypothetical protein [Stylosanthes scabra]
MELLTSPRLVSQTISQTLGVTHHIPNVSNLIRFYFQHMKKLKWILANSFYEIEKHVIDSMVVEKFPITTGYLGSSVVVARFRQKRR